MMNERELFESVIEKLANTEEENFERLYEDFKMNAYWNFFLAVRNLPAKVLQ